MPPVQIQDVSRHSPTGTGRASAYRNFVSPPELIEIVPLTRAPCAKVMVPGSKSITNRALLVAALARGTTTLEGALWSEDTQVMTEALAALGFDVKVEPDPREACNRTISIEGLGGRIPLAGSRGTPLELFVGNAGTAARFLAALVCLGRGYYRLSGVPRMHERPQTALFQALRALGYKLDTPNDKLPVVIRGAGQRPGQCQVSIEQSSQFASALLMCGSAGGWQVQVTGENAEESPYVAMTLKLIERFRRGNGHFQIEPDASSASYFWAANALLSPDSLGAKPTDLQSLPVTIANWPDSGWQIDAAFPRFLRLPSKVSRQTDLGDSILTAMILAPFSAHPVEFTDLGRLRVQECERVAAMRAELAKCGVETRESGDNLTILPASRRIHGAEIESYQDHRMAMCFAILGLKVPGICIRRPDCVKKTFPNFFQKLAAPAPTGLGVEMRDPKDGRVLTDEELFAG